jgi:hypothetical protein
MTFILFMLNRDIIEHVCFLQSVTLDICFDNRSRYVIATLQRKKKRKIFRLAVNMLQSMYALKKHN